VLPLDRPLLDQITLAAAAVALVALVLALIAVVRAHRLRRDFAVLEGPEGRETFLAAVNRQVDEVARLRSEVAGARSGLDTVRQELADSVRHVAVVRYDAFGDMGGRLSFSAALLDDAGDGLVLTSINGRSETRSYAKGVKGGTSEQSLSPEEEQAISFAMRGPVGSDSSASRA
jgi:hypothetical protein